MSSPSRGAVLALLFVAGLGLVAVAATGGGLAQTDDSIDASESNATMVVELESDGDATWTVSTTFDLATEEETAAYRDLASSFEDGTEPALGLSTFERAADRVTVRDDRSMAITDVERTTAPEEQVENGTGELSVTFTWENFARTDGDELHVDDVLTTDEGVWLSGLAADESLLLRPPDGYGVLSANVDENFAAIVGDASIRWTGPASFDEQSLQTVFIGDGSSPPPPSDNSNTLVWVLGGLVAGLIIAFAAYVAWRRGYVPATGSREDDSQPAEAPEPDTPDTEPAPAPSETEEANGGEVDAELLSDEERVIHLIEENGGRMKQADIVRETDWSHAKVSQLLSQMEDQGEINKLRIGRENLISFPDDDIAEPDEQR